MVSLEGNVHLARCAPFAIVAAALSLADCSCFGLSGSKESRGAVGVPLCGHRWPIGTKTVTCEKNAGVRNLKHAVRQLTGLRSLTLVRATAGELALLPKARLLRTLVLDDYGERDLELLPALPGLQRIDVVSSVLTSVDGIERQQSVRAFRIFGGPIESIYPLATMRQLEELRLYSVPIADISPLEHLTNLRVIETNDTRIVDLSTLVHLKKIEVLGLSISRIDNVDIARHLPALRRLDVTGTKVSTLEGLRDHGCIEEVLAQETHVSSMGVLTTLRALKYVDVLNSKVSSTEVHRFQKERPDVKVLW